MSQLLQVLSCYVAMSFETRALVVAAPSAESRAEASHDINCGEAQVPSGEKADAPAASCARLAIVHPSLRCKGPDRPPSAAQPAFEGAGRDLCGGVMCERWALRKGYSPFFQVAGWVGEILRKPCGCSLVTTGNRSLPGLLEMVWFAGARPYMEDCHTVVRNFKPLGPGGVPLEDGVLRTFAGVYDAHNGIKAAEHASTRWAVLLSVGILSSMTGSRGPFIVNLEGP